jgi:hypothetical protein
MRARKQAVIEDLDAFFAFLATTPIIRSVAERRAERDALPMGAKPAAKAGPDKELLEALKSMA